MTHRDGTAGRGSARLHGSGKDSDLWLKIIDCVSSKRAEEGRGSRSWSKPGQIPIAEWIRMAIAMKEVAAGDAICKVFETPIARTANQPAEWEFRCATMVPRFGRVTA